MLRASIFMIFLDSNYSIVYRKNSTGNVKMVSLEKLVLFHLFLYNTWLSLKLKFQ